MYKNYIYQNGAFIIQDTCFTGESEISEFFGVFLSAYQRQYLNLTLNLTLFYQDCYSHPSKALKAIESSENWFKQSTQYRHLYLPVKARLSKPANV